MPQVLNILLTDNDPDGRKKITLPGWTGHCFVFPRNKLSEMNNDEMGTELKNAGIYFIFGKKFEDNPLTTVYIGKSDNIFERLKFHNREERFNFWHSTVVFTSNDIANNHFSLESLCIAKAREVKHFGYDIMNIGNPAQQLHEFNTPFVEQFMNNINLILTTIGHPILQKVENEDNPNNPIFYCKSRNPLIKGTAKMTDEGFIVYKGSTIDYDQSAAVAVRNNKIIAKLLSENIIQNKGKFFIFKKNYKSATPNIAGLILGHSISGWRAWKTQDGKTLDEIYRPK